MNVLFSALCPALKREVILKKDTWYGHILKIHPDMGHKGGLVKRAIENTTKPDNLYKYTHEPKGSFFTQYKCPDFEPDYGFIRVAFKVLDYGTIVASAYKSKGLPKIGVEKYHE